MEALPLLLFAAKLYKAMPTDRLFTNKAKIRRDIFDKLYFAKVI